MPKPHVPTRGKNVTPEQLDRLEKEYAEEHTPSKEKLAEIAKEVEESVFYVERWFSEKRRADGIARSAGRPRKVAPAPVPVAPAPVAPAPPALVAAAPVAPAPDAPDAPDAPAPEAELALLIGCIERLHAARLLLQAAIDNERLINNELRERIEEQENMEQDTDQENEEENEQENAE